MTGVLDSNAPEWWRRALRLEAGDRLAEAEALLKESIPHLSFAYATADLYRRRMIRLLEAGDKTAALGAAKKARDFIFFYASQATSGSEGAALSEERDQFLAELRLAFGDSIPENPH